MARKAQASRLEVQNAARTLLANIRFLSVDNPIRSIVITSSVPNEGKSTVAIALARAVAAAGNSVILVECDMRNRTLADMLGVHAPGGLYAVLSEQMPLSQAIVQTSQEGMYLIDAEPHIVDPANILASKRFSSLTEVLEKQFDYVIYDTPPVGAFVDAAILSTRADATALVVRDNFTKRKEMLGAYDQLEKAGAHMVGAILNRCEATSSEHYYSYYNKNNKRDQVSTAGESTPLEPDASLFAPEEARMPGRHHVGAVDGARTAKPSMSPSATSVRPVSMPQERGRRER